MRQLPRNGGAHVIVVGQKVGQPKGYGAMLASREGDQGAVRVVERLQRYNFVALVDKAENRCGQSFRGSSGDEYLTVGVDVDVVEALLMSRDGVPKLGRAATGRQSGTTAWEPCTVKDAR